MSCSRHGHDSLAREFLSGHPDRSADLGRELVGVVLVRLAKYVFEHEQHGARLAMLKSEIMDQGRQDRTKRLPGGKGRMRRLCAVCLFVY